MQRRLPKYRRAPDAISPLGLTERSVAIIEAVGRYRFIGTRKLVQLVAGNEDVTHRHLQNLYHRDLISRLTLPRKGNKGEFIYFLDNASALRNLLGRPDGDKAVFDWDQIKANREKYSEQKVGGDQDGFGRYLFLRHELMISDFHANIELACRASCGRVELEKWAQGPALWNRVKAPSGLTLPHRPDAFFSLRFPDAPAGQQRSNFLYEADRNTSNATRMKQKLEAHLYFLIQARHVDAFGIKKVRAVIVETITDERVAQCKEIAADLAKETPLAALLFWFTTSAKLTGKDANFSFSPVWESAADERARSLLD